MRMVGPALNLKKALFTNQLQFPNVVTGPAPEAEVSTAVKPENQVDHVRQTRCESGVTWLDWQLGQI